MKRILNFYSNSYCLFSSGLVHTAAPPRLMTTIEVKVGEKVTFNCSLTADESRFVQWYKQSPGKIIETVASGAYSNVKLLKPFINQSLQVNNSKDEMFLTITSVTKEDEAEYFCQGGGEYLLGFKAGFLLTVKGNIFSIKHINNHPKITKLSYKEHCQHAFLQIPVSLFYDFLSTVVSSLVVSPEVHSGSNNDEWCDLTLMYLVLGVHL
uniref:Ig-like domain-containing protein n=1 Tax=Oryzias latipes TaxID=8090 RepID=A0A3P9KC47_ORYLA